MPLDILLDKEKKTLRTHASGQVTIEDFVEGIEKTLQLLDSGSIDASWGQIIDLTDVSSVEDLSQADVSQIAIRSPWPEGVRRAIIVTDEETQKLAAIYKAMGTERGHKIKLVTSIDQAEQWIQQSAPNSP